MASYNEDKVQSELDGLSPTARALFACACSERLMPSYSWYSLSSGADEYETVRQALDVAWSVSAHQNGDVPDLVLLRETVEAFVADEDESEMSPGFAVAQNAIASVAYSLMAAADPQAVVALWASRQLYEAADAVIQQTSSSRSYLEDTGITPLGRLVADGVRTLLGEVGSVDPSVLRARAEADGAAFLGYVKERVKI